MLTGIDQQVVREFQRCLVAIALALDLRVFGSRAKEDAALDSATDVSVS